MKLRLYPWMVGIALAGTLMWGRAFASPEDLKRQIEAQQAAIADLERLDEQKAVTGELTLERAWLDEAWGQFAKSEFDKVREILDRTVAQAELIRQKITASKLMAQAQKRESDVKTLREKIAHSKQLFEQAQVKRKALEMNIK